VLPNPKGHIILITAGAVPIILRIGVELVSVFIIMGIAIKSWRKSYKGKDLLEIYMHSY
jgi:hypothetical protein